MIRRTLRVKFHNSTVKITVCQGILKYILEEDRDDIFNDCHNSTIVGHGGTAKTIARIKQNYFWENMHDEISNRIRRCLKCQLKKYRRETKRHPLLITDSPRETFEKWAMDVCGPFQKTSGGNVYVLTIQDLLSKYLILIPMPDQTAETVANLFIKRAVCTFGCPQILLTDLGRNFISTIVKEMTKKFKIKKVFTTAYRPQSNGSIERSNTKLNEFLRMYTDKNLEWDEWIEYASFCYNTSKHSSTNLTPYEVLFGKEARLPYVKPSDKEGNMCDFMTDLVKKLNKVQSYAYEHLIESKERNKFYYDKSLNESNFKIGDSVFLKCSPNKKKTEDCCQGSFKIVDLIGTHNVKIKYKNKTKIVHKDKLRFSYIDA